jgi:hypothetical protein
MGFERQRNTAQSVAMLEKLSRHRVLPTLYELHPFDFQFDSPSIFEAKNTLVRVLQAIETHITALGLPPVHTALLQKGVMLGYLDQLDEMFDFQASATRNEKASVDLLKRYDQTANGQGAKLPRFQEEIIERASALFAFLGNKSPPSRNLRFVLLAMGLMAHLSDEVVKRALAASRNASVFTFSVFLRTYVTDMKMIAIILKKDEFALVHRFIGLATALRSEIGG